MRDTVAITDPEDPRIEAYCHIRERDLVGRRDRFIAEGRVVLDVLVSAGRFEVESVFVLDSRLVGLGPILAHLPRHVPLYVASRAIMDGIVGFPIHRGVLAIGRRRPGATLTGLIGAEPERSTLVVLSGIANHDNVGAIFRNAAAFGAGAVILDEASCDPLYRKAIRVSVGAVLRIPFVREGRIENVVDVLSQAGYRLFALSPGGSIDIGDIETGPRMALVFGSEGHGLPPALMERMTSVRIDMAPGMDSLNVAAASAIALHRLRGAMLSVADRPAPPRAGRGPDRRC
jgi:tRNA G18 (ribose-2'-O)-methylase SpoU